MSIADLFLLFITYSFFGWGIETVFCSILEKKFVYRGFLNGPICPIYGTGALAVSLPLSYININFYLDILLIFLSGIVICTGVEFLISVILEKIFKMKLWDYSQMPLNIHGRVWIGYSLGWGLLSIFLVKIINPFMIEFIRSFPYNLRVLTAIIFMIVFIADMIFTIFSIQAISNKLGELKKIFIQLQQKFKFSSEQGADSDNDVLETKFEDIEIENYRKLAQIISKRRIIRTFPNFTLKKFSEQIKFIKNKIKYDIHNRIKK